MVNKAVPRSVLGIVKALLEYVNRVRILQSVTPEMRYIVLFYTIYV